MPKQEYEKRYMSAKAMQQAISRLPSVPIAFKPTPLEECKRLTQALGGPRILVKRDDLTGPALGGNKARHMEFRLGDAISRGCDVYLYTNPYFSNAARVTAAACAKVGMRYILFSQRATDVEPQGNLLLDYLLGAELVFPRSEDPKVVMEEMRELAGKLKRAGWKPYIVQDEPAMHYSGIVGHMEDALELAQQLKERGIEKAHLYLVAGHTLTGFQLAAKLLGLPWRITGISIEESYGLPADVHEWSSLVAELLELPVAIEPEEVDTHTDYWQPGYGIPNDGCIQAIRLAASQENLIFDPVYTGKAMAGLVDHVRKGRVGEEETVVFIHTGGVPLVFQYAKALSKGLVKKETLAVTARSS